MFLGSLFHSHIIVVTAYNYDNCVCVRPVDVQMSGMAFCIYVRKTNTFAEYFFLLLCDTNNTLLSPSNHKTINVHVRLHHETKRSTWKLDVNSKGLQFSNQYIPWVVLGIVSNNVFLRRTKTVLTMSFKIASYGNK